MAEDNENTEFLDETAIPAQSSGEIGPNTTVEEAREKPHAFSALDNPSGPEPKSKIEFILDIPLEITVELGRTKMLINDLLKLGQGSIIELSKNAGGNLEILANQKLVARGEVVVVNDKYGIRLTEIVSPTERIESLK
jgi:flagellar motor switch protein FliN/FliY